MSNNRQMIKDLLKHIGELDYIDPSAFPDIDLYMDQVTTFMDSHLEHCKRHPDDKILTKTMINNYAKNDLLPAPEKKKYTKDHMLMLTLIYYYKNLLSISDIQTILNPLEEYYFAGKNKDMSMEKVYKQVYELCNTHRNAYLRDLIDSYELVNQTFGDAGEAGERDYIKKFSYVCLLGFDMYIKKVAMEKIIDDMRAEKLREQSHGDKKSEQRNKKNK